MRVHVVQTQLYRPSHAWSNQTQQDKEKKSPPCFCHMTALCCSNLVITKYRNPAVFVCLFVCLFFVMLNVTKHLVSLQTESWETGLSSIRREAA